MVAAPALGTLAAYERGVKGDAAYCLVEQVVQPLIHQLGALRPLSEFCTQVGDGERWRCAFARRFGITVDDFYREFAASP